MKILFCSLGIAATLTAHPLAAKTRYEPYEARNSLNEGQGGSRTTKDGVDFWTTGDPPRRYQIIGIIRDNRGTGALHGNAIGSSGIAKKVHEVGGDAVILLNQNSSVKGIWSQGQASAYGGQTSGSGLAIPIQERVTMFAVVKYLPAIEPTQADQSPSGIAPQP
ncbi:hypothetical protein [Sphingobium yanoikuyae]